MRPSDIPAIIGNPKKLRDATGWAPEIPLRQTLGDLLGHWRREVQRAATPPSPAVRA